MAQPEDATQREKYVRGVRTEVAVARTRSEAASLSGSLVELGFAGASFAVGVPFVSRWYPPE